jgi:hypothetical protein
MKRISLAVSVGLVAGLVGLSAQTAPVDKSDRATNDRTVTVTGCVAEGTEAGSYTLTSAKVSGNLASSPTTAGTAGTQGTEKSTSMEHRTSYQLKGGELKAHVGHKVEVTGTTSDDKRTDKSANVGTTDTMKDIPSTLTVKSVKMLSTTCP